MEVGKHRQPIDFVTVKQLTVEFARKKMAKPTCKGAWDKRGVPIPYSYGTRYSNKLLTPKMWMPHFKCILHRGMRVNANSAEGESKACRVCGQAREIFNASQSAQH